MLERDLWFAIRRHRAMVASWRVALAYRFRTVFCIAFMVPERDAPIVMDQEVPAE